MYIISSSHDTPDFDYLISRLQERMAEGIYIGDLSSLYAELYENQRIIALNLKNMYGIENPNSSQQVADFFKIATAI